MGAKTYLYENEYCTLAEIAQKANLDFEKFRNRVYEGWDVEAAIADQLEETPQLAPEWEGLNLVVRFPKILPVNSDKQPKCDQEYVAWIQGTTIRSGKAKRFYIIQLSDSTPLIVYPTEFEVIRAHHNQAFTKRNWMVSGYAG